MRLVSQRLELDRHLTRNSVWRQLRIARLNLAHVIDHDKRRAPVAALLHEPSGIGRELPNAFPLAADDFERLLIEPCGEPDAIVVLFLAHEASRLALLANIDAMNLGNHLPDALGG